MSSLETLGYLLAATCHDLDHPGLNNIYLVNSHSWLAHWYNDWSVLENHHSAVAFNIIFSCWETEIFGNLMLEDYISIR